MLVIQPGITKQFGHADYAIHRGADFVAHIRQKGRFGAICRLGSLTGHIKGGRLRAIAVAADKRAPGFADLVTAPEAGEKDYKVATWYGIWAPKGTPKDVVDRMQAEMKKAFASDEIKSAWNGMGAEVPALYGDDFGRFVSSEIKRWAEVVKTSGAKLD